MTEGVRVPLGWRQAAIAGIVDETARMRTLLLEVDWPGHVAGQHVDVRLTAEDGYQAERSYSIASPPEDPRLALTIERLDDGEVSPYLAGEATVGDQFELRGPIGGHFTWRVADGGPLLLLGGGSGLVPLMAMLRHRAARGSDVEARVLVSARRWDDVLYRDELTRLTDGRALRTYYALTRAQPPGWSGFSRRVDAAMLDAVVPPVVDGVHAFVCGPTPFVERAADLLVERGLPAAQVHTERFGPTGG
ncbi:MAG: FAD-binding oxidoreductase [Candidatus Dormibacteraceae bacterium]